MIRPLPLTFPLSHRPTFKLNSVNPLHGCHSFDSCEAVSHSFGRCVHFDKSLLNSPISGQLPRLKPNHRLADLEGERDFGKRSIFAANGDHTFRGPDNQNISCLPKSTRNWNLHPGIGGGWIGSGENADGYPPTCFRAAPCRRHHATQSATDNGKALLSEQTPDLLS